MYEENSKISSRNYDVKNYFGPQKRSLHIVVGMMNQTKYIEVLIAELYLK